ncbi:MAG: DUF3109 domain-containing protein [Ignavibacteriales bacterium CG_4_9_14_3_um_filter_30_11]|nr:MAG: DUF3109 domain-containing protein [Ignavibacteriales bacterium CG_4_9_14_3_um_filter_30_11]
MFESSKIVINDVLVREEIFTQKFTCDLNKCKGACCTLKSEFGAPLLENEISLIQENVDNIEKYLTGEHIKEIRENGFYEEKQGELMVRSINDKDCVFVYYENDIAKCSIEKAYLENKSSFKKPISCHLFPIRISNFGGDVLRYEKISECNPAEIKGEEANKYVYEFCEESLKRNYGVNWYSSLKEKTGR